MRRRIGDLFHSVRFRMALWFALILALVLLVFSVFVYYRESQAVWDETIAHIDYRQREIADLFRRTLHDNEEGSLQDFSSPSTENQLQLDKNEVLILANNSGDIVGAWGTITPQQAGELSKAAAQTHRFSYYMPSNGQKPTEYIFEGMPLGPLDHPLAYAIVGQPVDAANQLPRLALTLTLTGLATLLLAMAGGYWLADRALWPVKAITHTAREIGETDLSRRLNIHTRDELGELASTFDSMLDRLQAAFARQRQFTADASHELRTPLTIIGLETDRALAVNRKPEDYRRALAVVRSENEFMSRLVGELLTLARMDAGQVNLKRERIDLSDLVLEVVERYEQLAARKDIQLQAGELPELFVQGDRQYLVQMVSNLVDNAIKYTPEGPDRWIRVETGQRAGARGPLAWVRVSDNGMGIPQAHLPHLFDRFYRVDEARSHNPEDDDSPSEEIPGSGLGLSIVQWIANRLGGQVLVQSEPGQGSTFEIQLPLDTTPSLPAGETQDSAAPGLPAKASPK